MFGVNRNQPNLQQLLNLINGNPEEIYKQMYENNPQFKQFVDENKDLTTEQLSQKYGIPLK